MPVITIANQLNKERPMLNRVVFSPFEGLSNFKNIVAFNTKAWDNITSFIKLSVH